MAVTFHDWAGTIPATLTAAVTIGSTQVIGTDTVGVAMGEGTNTELVYKVDGLVKGLTKSTAAAFVNGDAVYFNGTAWAVATATTKVHGIAYGAQAAASTTADIILRSGGSLAVS